MSYDLTFLPKRDDESWDQAREAAEARFVGGVDAGAPDAAAWASIVADGRRIFADAGLGDVEESRAATRFELDHEATGIQLSLYAAEAAITVPYWHTGSAAEAVVDLMYQLAASVERHTGLAGYDGQLDLGVADAEEMLELAVAVFDQVAESFARRGVKSPGNDA